MRILITGAAGFIGSHLARAYIQAGHKVAGIDNLSTGNRENLPDDFELHIFDISNQVRLSDLLKRFRPEVISHHAAQVNVRRSWEDPLLDARSNILGSLALMHSAAEVGGVRQIIYSSSGGAIYGEPRRLPVQEGDRPYPLSNYGVSKYVTELYLFAYAGNAGLSSVIFRYSNIYGPRQDPKGEAGVVAVFTTQLLTEVRPQIYGDGSKTRDYLYVDDVVSANLLALNYQGSAIFNLGCGKEVSDLEVFETVREAVGSSTAVAYDKKRPGEIDHICLETKLVRQALGWSPKVDFREGVKRVVEYWKQRM